MSANDRQEGGDHYKTEDGKEQHWDRMFRLFGPGYFVGSITKYVERYNKKNGIEDLKKAKHFIEKLIELETKAESVKEEMYLKHIPTIDRETGFCTCYCGEFCPLGKIGTAVRCTGTELQNNGQTYIYKS